jgi:hypothetical protein
MSHANASAPESRPLTDAEHALLRWLLTRGAAITGTDAGLAAAFLPQLGSVRVVGRCGCGCPTVDLALAAAELAVGGASATLADVEGRSPEGTEIGVILRAADGRLCELELYARDGRVPFSIPGAEELQSFW